MIPLLGFNTPEITLKRVVFPEPLGPISPRSSPSSNFNETSLSAVKPPKCLVTLIVSNISFSKINEIARAEQTISALAKGRLFCEHRISRQGKFWIGRLHCLRPHNLNLAIDPLHDDRIGTEILAGKKMVWRCKLNTV